MENILHFTKQTHHDVQKTNDLVTSIHEATPNRCGSFQSDPLDCDDSNDGGKSIKYSILDRSAMVQQSPPEDDGMRNSYMLTSRIQVT
ncbi:MAG: hypothetical protein P4M11_11905 [Candidatus Pacebacteria bacterium]|nr:hypothetical protein [Candidatus Paceibacterota bacterium]